MIFGVVQRPRIHIHADDFGLSPSINRHIMDGVEAGNLTGVSIMANGHAVDEALQFIRQHPQLHISVHLNLLEGKPLSDIWHPLLTDGDRDFCADFRTLWLASRKMSPGEKKHLNDLLKEEIAAQVEKIRGSVPHPAFLKLDSHQHVHMIPAVWYAAVDVMQQYGLQHIRIPHEPFFLPRFTGKYLAVALGINWVKQRLLNRFSVPAIRHLAQLGFPTPQRFCGVLYTGKMDCCIVQHFLDMPGSQPAEILFHPGKADESEKHYWEKYPALWAYYTSPDREKEKEELLSLVLPEEMSKT